MLDILNKTNTIFDITVVLYIFLWLLRIFSSVAWAIKHKHWI